MPNLNKVQLIGRLGKTPESRFTPNQRQVTTFSLAVNRTWKDAAGKPKKETDWFNIEIWGKLAEFCGLYLSKGNLVYLEGRLKVDSYQKDGQPRQFTKVVASQLQHLDRRPVNDN